MAHKVQGAMAWKWKAKKDSSTRILLEVIPPLALALWGDTDGHRDKGGNKVKKQIIVAVVLAVILAASAYAQTNFFKLVTTGTPQDIQTAIDKGADVNAQDKDGTTPLMDAAAYNENPDAITTLLKAGADVNAQAKY